MEYIVYGVGALLLAVGVHGLFQVRQSRKSQLAMNELGDRLHEIR